jgi:hypothetical protein
MVEAENRYWSKYRMPISAEKLEDIYEFGDQC